MALNTNISSNDLLNRIEKLTSIGHWYLDLKHNELYWSEQVFIIHGLSPDYYTPHILTAIDAYVEEDRAYVRQCIESAIENAENYVFECRIKRVDGEIRSVMASGECETDENGKTIKIFGTIQDITEIKQEQERYELAITASNTAIWDWNTQSDEILWYGASCKVLGYPDNDALPETSKKFYNNLLHPDSQAILKKAFGQHFKTRNEFNLELQFKHGQNEYIWMLARGSAQWDNDGQAIRVIGALTQISEIKHTQAKLLRSNSDLEQFASIAAHDLQQPLRSISGFLELLETKYADKLDDQAKEYINHAIKGAQNMSELVADLLEYSRLETDGLKIASENPDTIVQNTLRHLLAAKEESGAKITFNNLPKTISCDAFKMQRVFYNLIENAIKYRGESTPRINISCKESKTKWTFTLQDNGIGMREDKLEEIFQMFQRLHNKNKYKGTGIGLAICKKIVELHGGKIWAESVLGEGTSFHFTLPKTH